MQKHDVRVGRSYAGLGLFAAKDFKKGDRVIEYVGDRVTPEEADKRGGMYLFEVTDRITIDGSARTNIARYINHCCKPNCEAWNIKNRIYIVALGSIKKDEELTYDYGSEHFLEHIAPHGCKCPSCRAGGKPLHSK
jgi:uncharacterized protein